MNTIQLSGRVKNEIRDEGGGITLKTGRIRPANYALVASGGLPETMLQLWFYMVSKTQQPPYPTHDY